MASSDYNTVGFITPDDDLIDGYIIYYKIYVAEDDDIDSDKDKFDDDDIDNELLSGTSLLKSLNFFKMGFVGSSSNDTIPWTGSGSKIIFDFLKALNQESDPILYIDGTDFTSMTENGIPARGVKYSDVYSGESDTFKRFINDYEFDPDLDEDLKLINTELDSNRISKIVIAFVAISTGTSASTLEQMMSIPVYLGTIVINTVEDSGIYD
ncbi:MAG: hypothetical protein B6241_07200 [Spirochaetaceae bacterium 4572_59]|nr:MAG: hypothetical protein B6241_07200 [Spirochaetaceae bacterium 4572_59]